MKIVRAMKSVSRLQGEIKDLKKRITDNLNALEVNQFSETFKDLMGDLHNKTKELIETKTKIMNANIKGNMFEVILTLGELKSKMNFLKELEPKSGAISEGYRETVLTYKTQWTQTEKNAALKETQNMINNLIDNLDEFNASTDCELFRDIFPLKI